MEFYLAESSADSELVLRFNSQRDGILLKKLFVYEGGEHVSIPNGMEFYINRVLIILKMIPSFNSQRDGILQSYGVEKIAKKAFQFPTGWNSTARILPFF